MLLREQGYACDRGEIFYAETRQRVIVEPGPELISRTTEIVAQARQTAAKLVPPPPLRSSPKCPRCSLVGICLPDETNLLAKRHDGPLRRLIVPERDVDVFRYSCGGWLLGLTTGLPSKNVMLRIRQVTAAAKGQLEAPRQMIAGKIRNCRVLRDLLACGTGVRLPTP